MSKKISGNGSVITDLKTSLQKLLSETKKDDLTTPARKKIEAEVRDVITDLGKFLNDLDPIRQPVSVFDPSNPKVVGRFVSLALVAQSRRPLEEVEKFYGSGVYAIYYNGDFAPYAKLSESETPIYVGQASPTIRNARTPSEQGDKLSSRLDEHRKNICRATSTLSIKDFEYRALVVQSGWETAAEDYLIHLFRPIWNSETNLVFGLGKHGDAASTRANKRSPWDSLHPGRTWAAAESLLDAKSHDKIHAELESHFEGHPVFHDMDALLMSFIDELKQV
jgi:hypothetical protein